MMLTDSCSLTPPVSPTHVAKAECMFQPKELHNIVKIPCFSCKGASFGKLSENRENYLDGGHFQKLLKREVFFRTSCATVLLFNKPFSVESALLQDGKKLFAFSKKQFRAFKILLNPNEFPQVSDDEVTQIRLQICSFLAFLNNFLSKIDSVVFQKYKEKSLPVEFPQIRMCLSNIITELKDMLFFAGRLHCAQDAMMNMFLTYEKRNCVASYHYFHGGLDLWWSALECLYIIHDMCNVVSVDLNADVFHNLVDSSRMHFNQVADVVIWDLCFLALKTFGTSSLDSSSPFVCSCINQFWIKLIMLLDKQQEKYDEKPFWLKFFNIVQFAVQKNHEVGKNSDSENNSIQDYFNFEKNQLKSDNLCAFFLWLTCHIAPLYKYDDTGSYIDTKKLKSCYVIPKYLIECILNAEYNTKNELHLRTMLVHFLSLARQWEPTGDVLLPLTDFYIKKIDDIFMKSKLEIQSMSYIFKSSVTWLDWIKNTTSENSKVLTTETSFQIYLRILSTQLTKSGLNGSLWRQLKGRILSKFTPKRIKELTEAGLQNCFSVFLTIALCTNVHEVSQKICDFAELMQAIPANIKRQFVAWKAMFVLVFIHQKQDQSLDKVAYKAVQLFNNYCLKYTSSSKDPMGQSMNLLLVYIESIEKVFENSNNLMMSEHLLIGSGLASLLPACTSELNFVLNILLNIFFPVITKTRTISALYEETHLIPLVKSLFEHVFPFIESSVTTNTALLQLSDLAVCFTYLAMKFPVSMANSMSSTSLFKYFANAENVNPAISLHYLNIMLKQQNIQVGQKSISIEEFNIVENLKCSAPEFFIVLMQAWIKCSICLPPPYMEVQELAKHIFQLDEIKKLLPSIQHVMVSGSLHDFLSIRLFKIMSESYQNGSMYDKKILKERIQLFFSNVPSIITLQIRQNASAVNILHLYKLIGHLVEYCAPLLYIKNSYSVLQKLIDIMVLPHKTFPKDKFLPSVLAKPIKDNLTLFITGILKLDYGQEPYVKRILKEIIDHYLDNFSIMSSENPLMNICISAATKNNFLLNQNAFRFLIDILKDVLTNTNPKSTNGFKFFVELLKVIPLARKKEVCEILMCNLLTLRFEGSISPSLENLLRTLFCILRKETELSFQSQVLSPLCQKILKQLAWSQFKVFRFFEYIGKNCPDVIMEFIPCIIKEIECIESKRGSGIEASLRRELKVLTDKLTHFKNDNLTS